MRGAQPMQVSVAVQGWLTHPLASVTLAVKVHVPGVVQWRVRTIVLPCPVKCAVSQPLKSTVKGPVPLVMVMVKSAESPTHTVAEAGVIAQTGLGTQMCVAVHGALTQPLASVTFAVKVQVPGAAHAWLRVTDPVTPVIVSLMQPLSTTVNGPVPLVTLTVKSCEAPTHVVAVPGEIAQIGLGTQMCVAVQGVLTQPLASVTFAVKVHVPGAVHA